MTVVGQIQPVLNRAGRGSKQCLRRMPMSAWQARPGQARGRHEHPHTSCGPPWGLIGDVGSNTDAHAARQCGSAVLRDGHLFGGDHGHGHLRHSRADTIHPEQRPLDFEPGSRLPAVSGATAQDALAGIDDCSRSNVAGRGRIPAAVARPDGIDRRTVRPGGFASTGTASLVDACARGDRSLQCAPCPDRSNPAGGATRGNRTAGRHLRAMVHQNNVFRIWTIALRRHWRRHPCRRSDDAQAALAVLRRRAHADHRHRCSTQAASKCVDATFRVHTAGTLAAGRHHGGCCRPQPCCRAPACDGGIPDLRGQGCVLQQCAPDRRCRQVRSRLAARRRRRARWRLETFPLDCRAALARPMGHPRVRW